MLIKDKDGDILRARIEPGFMTVVTTYEEDGEGGRAAEFPGATLTTWQWQIVQATDEERALMREHGILPEEHTLWVEDAKGRRHKAHLEFAAQLNWDRLRCATAMDCNEPNSDFEGCRVVAASPSDVKLLRRFGLHLKGLDEIEDQLEGEPVKQRAAA